MAMPENGGLQYYNPYASQIADVMGKQGQIQSDLLQHEADIKAGLVNTVAHAGLSVLGDFTRMRREEPQRQLELARLKEINDAQRDDDLTKKAMVEANGDPQIALSNLRRMGQIGVNAAGKLQKQVTDEARSKLQDTEASLRMFKTKLDLSAPILASVQSAPEPQRATAYQEALPKIRELVGPELAQGLPNEYSPDAVNRAMMWGLSASQIIDQRRLAIEEGRKAIEDAKNIREVDGYATKALASWLPTVHDQQGWDAGVRLAKSMGATPEMLARFGDTYTPEAAKSAARWGLTPEERLKQTPVLGSLPDYITTYAREIAMKPPEQLSLKEKTKAIALWTAAGTKPEKDGGMSAAERELLADGIIKNPSLWGNLTETKRSEVATTLIAKGFTQFDVQEHARVAVAERWRADQMIKIGLTWTRNSGISEAEWQQHRDMINASFAAQTGQGTPPAAPTPPPVIPATGAPTAPAATPPTKPAIIASAAKILAGKPATDKTGAALVYQLKDKAGVVTNWKITPGGPVQVAAP